MHPRCLCCKETARLPFAHTRSTGGSSAGYSSGLITVGHGFTSHPPYWVFMVGPTISASNGASYEIPAVTGGYCVSTFNLRLAVGTAVGLVDT